MVKRQRAKTSLTASEAGIEQARIALTYKNLTYRDLENELSISYQPVVNFFNGRAVKRTIFVNICQKLELDWQKIVGSPISQPESKREQKEPSNTQPVNTEPEQVEEVLDNFCDEVIVERVRSHSPLCAEDFNKLGIKKAEEGDFERALENFDRAIKLKPDYEDAYNNRASIRHELRNYAGAIEDCTEAILLNPNRAVYHNNLGIISYSSNDYRGAQADHTRATQINSGDAQAYNNRGFARLRLGDLQGALKDFTQAIEPNPNDALDDYTQAPRLNPKTFYYLGVIHSRLGNKEKALEDFTKAIELKRHFAEAYQNRGIVHYELGYSQKADVDFHNAKNLYRVQGKEENYQKLLDIIEGLHQED